MRKEGLLEENTMKSTHQASLELEKPWQPTCK